MRHAGKAYIRHGIYRGAVDICKEVVVKLSANVSGLRREYQTSRDLQVSNHNTVSLYSQRGLILNVVLCVIYYYYYYLQNSNYYYFLLLFASILITIGTVYTMNVIRSN